METDHPFVEQQLEIQDKPDQRLFLGKNVSIATAAYGNEAVTRKAISALFRSVKGEYELILVDDCSPDHGATLRVFKEAAAIHANTKIFSFPQNLEYSGSVNAILSSAEGELIFFISNDIFVTPSYFDMLLEVAGSEDNLGILRGSSNFVDNGLGSHNLSPIHDIQTVDDVFREGRDVAALFGSLRVPDPYLTGDAFMVTRALIDTIGGFDPLFYGYFADHDFGLRSRIAGFQNLLVPGAFAYHEQGVNFDYLSDQKKQAKLHRRWARVYENWARFKLKYGLPVSLPYTSINDIPWQELEQQPFRQDLHFSPRGEYMSHLAQEG